MADSPTTRLNLRQQSYNDNPEVWGDPNLNQVIQSIDDAIAGVATVSAVAPTTTLTATNYATNQARMAGLTFTGSPGADFAVVTPSITKPYFVRNLTTSTANVKTSLGANLPIPGGYRSIIFGDGLDFRHFTPPVTDVAGGLLRMSGVASAIGANQPTTFANNISQFGAPTGNLDMGGFRIVNTVSANAANQPLTFSNTLNQLSAPTANVPMGSNRITGLAAGVDGTDAPNLTQVAALIASATTPAPGGAVRVTATDTSANFLQPSIAPSGISTTLNNPGGDETLTFVAAYHDFQAGII